MGPAFALGAVAYFRDGTEGRHPCWRQATANGNRQHTIARLADNAVSSRCERLAGNRRCDIIG
jgi:hypothetical protein